MGEAGRTGDDPLEVPSNVTTVIGPRTFCFEKGATPLLGVTKLKADPSDVSCTSPVKGHKTHVMVGIVVPSNVYGAMIEVAHRLDECLDVENNATMTTVDYVPDSTANTLKNYMKCESINGHKTCCGVTDYNTLPTINVCSVSVPTEVPRETKSEDT